MSLSIIMPTCGRPTLSAAIGSVAPQLAEGDELIVIGDGGQPHAEWLCRLADTETAGRVVYGSASMPGSRFGNVQRDVAIGLATGTHLCFLDDDDIYLPDALTAMRHAAGLEAHAVHVFRARWGAGHHAAGTVLWRTPAWVQGNVGTPMVVIPHPRSPRAPRWMDFNDRGVVSDFGWMSAAIATKRIRWHDQVVATVRPEPVQAAA